MTKNKFLATLAAFGLVAGALLSTTAPAFADKPAETGHTEIDLCHAKGPNQPTNGWTITPVDDSSVIDTAHFTNHEYDIIPITAGTPQGKNLDTVWGGYTGAEILANGCSLPTPPPPTDVCTNIDGIQTEVPEGYTEDDGECSPPEVIDVCTNIDGDQAEVPEGYTEDDGECFQDNPEVTKYSICHATEVVGAKNGWLSLGPLPAVAIVSGHGNHSGDIIPVIEPDYPNGQNLDTLYPNYGPGVTGADILEEGCPDSVVKPDLATATLTFIPATCDAPEQLDLGNSPISNATWGNDTDGSALGYHVVATADEGAEFADGDGDPGNLETKTFSGTLDDVLDDPSCDEVPDLATATLTFIPATCDAPEQLDLGNSPISNATWGTDTDGSALGYHVVATADEGAEFADGDGDPGNLETKTFSGTLDDVLDDPSCDEVPDLATATLEFTPASCFAAESPNIAGSSISNATWGSDTDASPLGYTIVATANQGAQFADGDPGGMTKTFTGTLDPIFADNDPRCLDTLGLVLPQVVFTQATCSAAGSYTLGVAQGFDPTHVTFTVNGVAGVLAGTYPVVGAQEVTVTVQPVAPNGIELEWVDPPAFSFVDAGACGQLTTLALTGAAASYLGWTVGGGALFLGAALLFMRRRSEKSTD